MDIGIINTLFHVFDTYGEDTRVKYEQFEEILNDEAPALVNERYLVVQGMRTRLFDIMFFGDLTDLHGYVRYALTEMHCQEDEAVFISSVFREIAKVRKQCYEIDNIEQSVEEAYKKEDTFHLRLFAYAYYNGTGVAQDYAKAFEIFQFLYDHEEQDSVYYLGYMYENGLGIEQNMDKALDYYSQADEYDNEIYYRLGLIYLYGIHVKQDIDKAMENFDMTTLAKAYYHKAVYYESRKDYAKAFEEYHEGATLYQPDCLYYTGMYLKRGIGVDLNLEEAKHYFEYGYYLFHGDSAYELSMMYFDGVCVEKDIKKAMHYLHQAATLGSVAANQTLAHFYETGMHVKKNYSKAIAYMQKAQELEKEESHESL